MACKHRAARHSQALPRLGWLVVLLLTLVFSTLAQAQPRVLVSIKPLALIAQEVVGDLGQVDTLLPITASAHDYPLKMSDHRRLRDADLVLWVGPELESFLARPLANLKSHQVLQSYGLPGLNWPQFDADDQDHDDHHAHQHSAPDPHVWLDPRNAAVIAQALAQRLGQLSPENALVYQRNAELFAEQLARLDQYLSAQLAPLKTRGFAVYHEGYSHFVARYGLHQLAYVTFTPERRPGARHLVELRALLAQEGQCVFLEPYQSDRAIREMAASLDLNIGLLDAIGNDQVTSYQDLMKVLTQSFVSCLGGELSQTKAHQTHTH